MAEPAAVDPGTQPSPPTTPTPPPSPPPTTPPEPKEEPGEKQSLLNEKPPVVAPEKYEDFKVPEGYTLDGEVGKEASAMFKELNLPQEAAQRLVDFYVKQTQEAFDQPYKAYIDMRES